MRIGDCRVVRVAGVWCWRGSLLCVCVLVSACGDSKMTMDTTMKGDLATSLKLEGPVQIQMQMQGPTVKYEGVYISDKLLERVKVGETGTDWLVAVMGEPTGKGPLRDGGEIWKWSYRPLEQTASVVSVFGASKDEPALQPSTAFVRVKDGVVVEKWRD
jgi:hypothetical protein